MGCCSMGDHMGKRHVQPGYGELAANAELAGFDFHPVPVLQRLVVEYYVRRCLGCLHTLTMPVITYKHYLIYK